MPHINGTITTGGQAQTLLNGRIPKSYFFKNDSNADLILTDDGSTPSPSNGVKIPAGAAIAERTEAPEGPLKVYGANTGQAFSGKYR